MNQKAIAQLLLRKDENESSDTGITINRLMPLIYDEVRAIAHRQLRQERHNHTLQTTALANEAYLKLAGNTEVSSRGRAYFFAAVSRAMREILVDYARQRNRLKRGGGVEHTTLKTDHPSLDDLVENIIGLDSALQKLESRNPRHARVVECRFFSGLSVEETACALDVSPRTVRQDWTLARAWLFRELNYGDDRS